MAEKSLWFGRLLDWRWDPQTEQHTAWHGGQSHYIVKLDRQSAEAKGSSRGWHLIQDDEYDQPDIGVLLSSYVAEAKATAEAWIVCGESDMRRYPSLHSAMYSGSVFFEGLVIARDNRLQRFTVRRSGEDTTTVGVIRPVFLGHGAGVSIRWRACGPVEQLISGHDCWAEATQALREAVA